MENAATKSMHPAIDKLLFATGIMLLLVNSFAPISYNNQIIFFLFTVLLAGIPHGALDHLVEEKNLSLENKNFSWLSFLAHYFLTMILFGLIWYFFPSAALIIFIVFSAIHFGETDLLKVDKSHALTAKCMQFCYGFFILLILLLSHLDEVRLIVEQYPALATSQQLLFLETHTKDIIFSAGIVAAGSAFVYFLKTGQDKQNLFSFAFFNKLVLILLLLIKLPLIISFAFYFGLWHSLHSLENIRLHLSGAENRHIGWASLLKKSLPLTFMAILFIVTIIYLSDFENNSASLLLQFFIGIAVLTAPHLQVMGKMYKKI